MNYPMGEAYEPWTRSDELLTQLLWLTGLTAAERRLKKPFEPYRPAWQTAGGSGSAVTDPETVDAETTGDIHGHAAIMAKAAADGHLRIVS